ncbi:MULTISPECIES: redoxin domain-containing protein [Microbulbifer]|uniref:redoxin domain-containing protein n=1 Tax=Microbulbifer TaxID=48073 RepID=UPI001E51FECE|nr:MULTISPECIES: redoxin domain-containing protein [Microbulbifer]UHQ54448.1 redoxin family protein [Microbulbifer sp. YPW16]
MSRQSRPAAGEPFPEVLVTTLDGKAVQLGHACEEADWTMVVVYRGQHCPLCTRYLNQLENYWDRLCANKVGLMAVSADSREQLQAHMEKLEVSFPVAYGLTVEQMQALGVYISVPRSAAETDHNFAEPGIFVVNQDGNLHVVDISNNPFARPDIEQLVSGLEWIRDPKNDYPVRGTFR